MESGEWRVEGREGSAGEGGNDVSGGGGCCGPGSEELPHLCVSVELALTCGGAGEE